jgi:hypothetical protein
MWVQIISSWNWQPSAAASRADTVALPNPETPIAMAITGSVMVWTSAGDHTRCNWFSHRIMCSFSMTPAGMQVS